MSNMVVGRHLVPSFHQ